jgi:hypothetical protein
MSVKISHIAFFSTHKQCLLFPLQRTINWGDNSILFIFLLLTFFFTPIVYCQDLEQIGQKDAVTVSGGMGYNAVANFVDDQPRYRDPLSWVYSGNLNVTVLGVSLPFTFSFSNAGKSYTQPFNMTALHPSYKWVKTHIGITSMNFSPYTYSGLNFAGGGLELSPKKWRIQTFGGRLKKAIAYDPIANNVSTVSYKRMGYGLSLGYEGQKAGGKIILLKAFDDERSLESLSPNTELTAMDNIVTSFSGKVTLLKTLQLQAEFANSLLTRNVLLVDNNSTTKTPFYYGLIRGNSSSVSTNAYNASLNYRFKIVSISLKYEHIDPNYLTLGGLFFNNDLENITIAPTIALLKNKLTISVNTGFQRNNLSNQNATAQKRWVGNISISSQPFKGMNLSGNYSNFASFSRRNPSADPFYNVITDTMNFYQTSENYNTNANYTFGKSTKQALSGCFSYSKSENITGRLQDAAAFGFNVTGNSTPTKVYTAMISHSFQLGKGFGLGYVFNFNEAITIGQTTTYFGPGITASKPLLNKKLNLHFRSTYNRQLLNNTLTNHVMNIRFGANASPDWWDKKRGKITLGLNANFTQKFAVADGALSPKNLTVIANVNYAF